MKQFRSLMTRAWLLLAALFVLQSGAASADFPAPDVLVKSTSEEVLRFVADDKDLRNGSSSRFIDFIDTKVLPHFDMPRMTRLAVGKSWRQATSEQQKRLVQEFQTLLVRSYGAAYSAYRHVTVDVTPLKVAAGEDDVTVKSKIMLPGGAPPVPVDYAMNVTNGGWKVYNVVVDGVSLVTNYRTEFGAQISQGGIDGLIKYLQDRNSKAPQAPAAPAKK